jgi:hypothetical protein
MQYNFVGWVHKNGSDDICIKGHIICEKQETAYRHIKKILKKEGSTVLNDFTISVVPE